MGRNYDLAIIGSGPGGHAAAMAARRRGLHVALIEREQWGGVCLNVGCIPTKALAAVAHAMRRIRQATALGIQVSSMTLDYALVLQRNERLITTLRQGVVGLLRRQGVELLTGTAALTDPHTLRIVHDGTTQTVVAERVIIATGARPSAGPWAFDGRVFLSYRDLLRQSSQPTSLLMIGGGVIGCEFASCFASFGTTVTLIEQQPQVLPQDDPEAVRVVTQALQARGVTIHVNATVQRLRASAEGVRADLADGTTVNAQQCLMAIGLQPNTRELGLETLGLGGERGVEVNEGLLTRHPHIAAIGDCLPGHGLAHLASAEGGLAVHNLCAREPQALDRRLVPRCVYTDPELAQVGCVEADAPASARVSRFSFAALGKSLCDEEPEGFVKLIVDTTTDKVLGATIVGTQASTLIHLAVLAMQHGLTAKQLARSLTAHPTLSEALTEAAAQLYGEALYSAGAARPVRSHLRGPHGDLERSSGRESSTS